MTPKSFDIQEAISVPVEQYEKLRKKYERLRKDYEDIHHNYDLYKTAYMTLRSKYLECKTYLQKLKEQDAAKRDNTDPGNNSKRVHVHAKNQATRRRASKGPLEGGDVPSANGSEEEIRKGNVKSNLESDGYHRSSAAINQINQDEDELLIVSERRVKRKRSPKSGSKTHENCSLSETPRKRVKVKLEPSSSPAGKDIGLSVHTHCESFDLDEVGEHAITPKKHAKLFKLSGGGPRTPRRRLWIEERYDDRAMSEPANVKRELQSIELSLNHGVGNVTTTALETCSQDHAIKVKSEARADDMTPNSNQQSQSTATDSSMLRRSATTKQALQELSTNTMTSAAYFREGKEGHEGFIGAEEQPTSPQTSATSPLKSAAKSRIESEKRLNALLGGITPDKQPLQTAPPRRLLSDWTITGKIKDEFKNRGYPMTPMNPSVPVNLPSAARTFAAKTPAQSSLRKAPLSRLTLSDFKPNPAQNLGFSRNFTASVRGNAKQCLPGCTNPICCGPALRAAVAAGSVSLPPLSSSLFPSSATGASSGNQNPDDENEQLLRWHLGGAYNPAILPSDRARLLLDAKTRRFADKYGKHRQLVGERQRTPPGFWRTEMPDTQEEERDREEARRREREEVERRWGEAVREGGRWLFRDE